MQGGGESAGTSTDDENVMLHTDESGVGSGPGFEFAVIVFVFFVESDVGERLVWHELLLLWFLSGEIEVGMPCA